MFYTTDASVNVLVASRLKDLVLIEWYDQKEMFGERIPGVRVSAWVLSRVRLARWYGLHFNAPICDVTARGDEHVRGVLTCSILYCAVTYAVWGCKCLLRKMVTRYCGKHLATWSVLFRIFLPTRWLHIPPNFLRRNHLKVAMASFHT